MGAWRGKRHELGVVATTMMAHSAKMACGEIKDLDILSIHIACSVVARVDVRGVRPVVALFQIFRSLCLHS